MSALDISSLITYLGSVFYYRWHLYHPPQGALGRHLFFIKRTWTRNHQVNLQGKKMKFSSIILYVLLSLTLVTAKPKTRILKNDVAFQNWIKSLDYFYFNSHRNNEKRIFKWSPLFWNIFVSDSNLLHTVCSTLCTKMFKIKICQIQFE